MHTRRHVLACVAIAGIAMPDAARSFRLEEADADSAADIAAACSRSTLHDELRAEIDSLLQGQTPPAQLSAELDRLSVCPLCRCRITLADAAPRS